MNTSAQFYITLYSVSVKQCERSLSDILKLTMISYPRHRRRMPTLCHYLALEHYFEPLFFMWPEINIKFTKICLCPPQSVYLCSLFGSVRGRISSSSSSFRIQLVAKSAMSLQWIQPILHTIPYWLQPILLLVLELSRT